MSTVTTNELKKYGLPEDDTVMFEQFLNDTAGYNVEKMDSEITRLDAAIDGKVKLNNESIQNVNFIGSDKGIQSINGMDIVADESVSPSKTTFFEGLNLFNKDTIVSNSYIIASGGIVGSNSNYYASDYIKIEPNKTYYYQNFSFQHYAFYDSNKVFVSSVHGSVLPPVFTVQSNAYYIRVSIQKTNDLNTVILSDLPTSDGNKLKKAYIPKVDVAIDQLTFLQKTKNLFNKNNVINGFYVASENGVLISNAIYCVSDFIEILPNTIYSRSHNYQIAFYDSSKTYVSGINNTTSSITTPTNAKYVRLSVKLEVIDTFQFEIGNKVTEYIEYNIIPKKYLEKDTDIINIQNKIDRLSSIKPDYVIASSATITDGVLIIDELNCIKKNNQITLSCDISTITEIKIGHGQNLYNGNWVTIDNTNVTVVGYTSTETVLKTEVHGLMLSDFLKVIIDVDSKTNAKITILTSKGMFTTTVSSWQGCTGNVFMSVAGTINNTKLTFRCNDYKKKIFVYGDSYIGLNSDVRWPKYLIDNNFDNILLDGFSGRNTPTAYTSFLNTLKYGTPSYCVWLMGMNDYDNGAINQSWLIATQNFINKCNSDGIIPIFATIPSVPDRDNSYKNEWIRNSGYRYIDCNKAVGADKSVNWYSNMLNTDKVHPTELGAKALFMQVLMDFPEIMIK